MRKIVLASAAALALSACADSDASTQALRNTMGAAVDERALALAIDQSIDRKAAKDVARTVVAGTIRDAVPVAELRAAGVVIDEKALAKGVDKAIDGKAMSDAIRSAIKSENVGAK
jgi:hypothetical protein